MRESQNGRGTLLRRAPGQECKRRGTRDLGRTACSSRGNDRKGVASHPDRASAVDAMGLGGLDTTSLAAAMAIGLGWGASFAVRHATREKQREPGQRTDNKPPH